MGSDIPIEIHELQNEIDPLCRRIRFGRRHDVAFTHDRHSAFDHKAAARIAVANNGTANHNAFMWLEFDFEGHSALRGEDGPGMSGPVDHAVDSLKNCFT